MDLAGMEMEVRTGLDRISAHIYVACLACIMRARREVGMEYEYTIYLGREYYVNANHPKATCVIMSYWSPTNIAGYHKIYI